MFNLAIQSGTGVKYITRQYTNKPFLVQVDRESLERFVGHKFPDQYFNSIDRIKADFNDKETAIQYLIGFLESIGVDAYVGKPGVYQDYQEPEWAKNLNLKRHETNSLPQEPDMIVSLRERLSDEKAKRLEAEKALSKKRSSKEIKKYETGALCTIETLTGVKLIRQYTVRHNSGKIFYIDGYDEENKIAYEVDEPHHKYQRDEDALREEMIREVIPDIVFKRIPIAID